MERAITTFFEFLLKNPDKIAGFMAILILLIIGIIAIKMMARPNISNSKKGIECSSKIEIKIKEEIFALKNDIHNELNELYKAIRVNQEENQAVLSGQINLLEKIAYRIQNIEKELKK